MKTKILSLIKILFVFPIAFVITVNFNLCKVALLSDDINLLNVIGVMFAGALAVLSIFFSLLQMSKERIDSEIYNTSFKPLIREIQEDTVFFFVAMVILMIRSILDISFQFHIFGVIAQIEYLIKVVILILSILSLSDLLSAVFKLVEYFNKQ